MDKLLKNFPEHLRNIINKYCIEEVEEIRIRNNKPVILKFNQEENVLDYVVNSEDILYILQNICDNSIYTYQNQICEGYITIQGGHRVRYNRKCSNARKQSY